MIHKYLVTHEVKYQSKQTFTVLAMDNIDACNYVEEMMRCDRSELSAELLKHNIKGTKQKGIIKSSGKQYFY